MRNASVLLTLAAVMATGLSSHAQTARATVPGTVSGTQPVTPRLAPGTNVKVRMSDALSSKTATSGQAWSGILADNIVAVNGRTLVLAGADVTGVIADAESAKHLHAPGFLSLRLLSVGNIEVGSNIHTKAVGESVAEAASKAGASAVSAKEQKAADRDVTIPADAIVTFTTALP